MDIGDSQRIKQIRDNTEKMADAFTRIAYALERLTEPQHDYEPAEPFEWGKYMDDIKTEPQTMYYPQVDGITPSVIEPQTGRSE